MATAFTWASVNLWLRSTVASTKLPTTSATPKVWPAMLTPAKLYSRMEQSRMVATTDHVPAICADYWQKRMP